LKYAITKDMTTEQRMKVIRRLSKKFSKKLNRNQRVRKTETSFMDKYDTHNINQWTDAPKYVDEYYGDRARGQESYDKDWN